MLKVAAIGTVATLAVLLAVLALRPAAEGVPVWVVTAQVEFGTALDDSTLSVVVVPEAAVPTGAFDADSSPGGAVADRFIPAGTVLAQTDVRGSERSRLLRPGETLLELPVAAEHSAGLQTGEIVDLWGQIKECTDGLCPPERLAAAVRVLQVQQAQASAWSGGEIALVAVAIPTPVTGNVLLAQNNETLQFALRAIADSSP